MPRVARKFLVSRRYGCSLWGQARDAVAERKYPPGQHGVSGYAKKSDFAKQLEAKQKLRFHYNMRESQFRKVYKNSAKKKGDRVANFVAALESRLDVLIYRAKLAPTIFAARQIVSHSHVLLNDKKANIPSMLVPVGSVLKIKQKLTDNPIVLQALEAEDRDVPEYLELDKDKKLAKLSHLPSLENIPYAFEVNVGMISHIIAYYSH